MDYDETMPPKKFRIRRIWLPSMLGRLTSLLMGFSLLTLYFYLLGNAQGFTDRTLIILFNIELWILSMTTTLGMLSAISYLATLPFREKTQLIPIVFSMLAAVLSLVLYLGVALLQAFMDGYAAS